MKHTANNIAPQRTPGAANVKIFTRHFRTTCHSQLKAKITQELPDSNIKVGINIMRIIWGCNFYTIAVELPIIPKLYLKYPRKIPKTRSIGVYGNLYLLLTYLRKVPARMPNIMKKITRGPE